MRMDFQNTLKCKNLFFSPSPFLGMTSDPPINHACTLFLPSSRDLEVWGQLGKNLGLIYNTNRRNFAS